MRALIRGDHSVVPDFNDVVVPHHVARLVNRDGQYLIRAMAMAVCRPSGDAAADEEEYGQHKCRWNIVLHDCLPRLIGALTKRDGTIVGAAALHL